MKYSSLNVTGLKTMLGKGKGKCDAGPSVCEVNSSEFCSVQPREVMLRGSFVSY